MNNPTLSKPHLCVILLSANLAIIGCIYLLIDFLISNSLRLEPPFWTMLFIASMLFTTFFFIKKKSIKESQKQIFFCVLIVYTISVIIYENSVEVFLFWIILMLISNIFWGTESIFRVFISTALIYLFVPEIMNLLPEANKIGVVYSAARSLTYPRSFMHLSTIGIIILLIIIYNRNSEELILKKEEEIVAKFNQDLQKKNPNKLQNESAAIFHDIKNLISIQSLCIETINSMLENQKDNKSQKYLKVLKPAITATNRLTLLVDVNKKMLMSQAQLGFFSPAREVEAILDYHKTDLLNKDIKITKKLDKKIFINNCKSSFFRIAENLITNSIDSFAKYDGRCNNEINVTLIKQADQILFSITDNGCGINKLNMNKIFESNFSTKLPQDGTGIGLPIVKSCVECAYNGTIEFASTEDVGSTFTVKLPLS